MLRQLRSSAAGIVAKLLVVLLIISFAAWGVTDYIYQPNRGDAVATIAGDEISSTELGRAFELDLRRYQQQGLDITAEQAKTLGLLDQTLQRLVSQRVYEVAGKWLDMGISDSTVRMAIQAEPSFFDDSGNFSRLRYELILSSSGISEAQFVRDMRRDTVRRQIINSLDYSGGAPDALVQALHRHRGEKRIAVYAKVPVDRNLDVGEAQEETLRNLHTENEVAYTAPERRKISYIRLSMENAMSQVEVSEEQIRQRYDENLAAYTDPEKRTVQQILASDEETAKKVLAAIGEGRTFEAVAKDIAGQEAADIELGSFSESSFPDKSLWGAVAGLESGAVSQPVESGFGWHVFRVTEIVPERVVPYEEARAQIEQEIREEEVGEVIYNWSTSLEDALAGGATLEETAGDLGLKVNTTPAVDIGGSSATQDVVEGLPGGDFLDTAFISESGAVSPVVQLPEGDYYALRVDEIVPSALRPFEEVRNDIAAKWKADQQFEAARKRALDIVARLEGGESLTDIASTEGLTASETKPFDRRGGGLEAEIVTPTIVGDLFNSKPGQPAMDETPDAFILAQLKSIEPVSTPAPEELAKTLGNQMIGDVLVQFNNGLREEFTVLINQAALDRF